MIDDTQTRSTPRKMIESVAQIAKDIVPKLDQAELGRT